MSIEKKLGWRHYLKYALETSQGMAYLHGQITKRLPFVVHGNLRSDNLLLTEFDRVKIADYGFEWQYPYSSPTWAFVSGMEKISKELDVVMFGRILCEF